MDSLAKRTLPYATVSLVRSKDSSLVSFARSNDQGFFTIKNVAAGKYLLSISYVGYQQQWLAFKTGTNAVLNVGKIYLQDASNMSSVTVTARRPPVVINGDSIEFNAENFKTAPNAVVEDLLKKMPGIEVDKSGAITVNGKTVTKVFVNGKEFFTGDPKMATKNLPADAIDKIQVYDRKSDQAMFTGIDDGTAAYMDAVETARNLQDFVGYPDMAKHPLTPVIENMNASHQNIAAQNQQMTMLMAELINKLNDTLNKPKEVVRDETGRVVGVR